MSTPSPGATATTTLAGLTWLLVCQCAGEVFIRFAHLRFPGPVVGMLLLLVLLRWEVIRTPVAAVADALLAHLSLLFVPVGVGIMTHMGLVTQHGFRLALALVLSTWIGLTVTALVLRAGLKANSRASGV